MKNANKIALNIGSCNIFDRNTCRGSFCTEDTDISIIVATVPYKKKFVLAIYTINYYISVFPSIKKRNIAITSRLLVSFRNKPFNIDEFCKRSFAIDD